MGWKVVLSLIFFILVIGLLISYWFLPIGELLEFKISGGNSNFTLNASLDTGMQFYENMRYQTPNISYSIASCPLAREDEMKRAFDFLETHTILNFYEVGWEEEISVTCEDSVKGEKGLFIAGEGGVTNVTVTKNFNVIFNGIVVLIRETKCPDPIVGTHELLHSLGFDHSDNPNNIMYPTVNCKQTIGEDLVDYINEIYSFPTLSDLSFENASASMKGGYLNFAITIRNHGLKNSENSTLIIYADNNSIKELEIEPISIGSGRMISLSNVFVMRRNIEKLELFLKYDSEELNKDNNRITLEIKE
jgi:hypothetical protein